MNRRLREGSTNRATDNDPDYIPHSLLQGFSLPGLHPHLQGLPGFPIGSQMVQTTQSNGRMGESNWGKQLVPSICQRQLRVPTAYFSSTVKFLFPCVSGTVPGPMGGQMAAEWLNMGSLHQQEYENPEWAAAAAAEILLHVCAS